jgi:sugar lactone lactonase YvrE
MRLTFVGFGALAFAFLLASGCNCGPSAACAAGGTGGLTVTMSGLPGETLGPISLSGPSSIEVTGAQTVSAASGSYSVTGRTAVSASPLVRTLYEATWSPDSVCVPAGGAASLAVTWAPVPASGKLWWLNGAGGHGELLGYPGATVTETATVPATVAATGPAGRDLTFDKDGNLWTLGPTTADPTVVRFGVATLGGSGDKTPDRQLGIEGLSCQPGATGLAFDPSGNLYVSSACEGRVYKLSAASLGAASGEVVTPALVLAGLGAPQGLAFDASGNLYVADPYSGEVLRFDASALSGSAAPDAPSARLRAFDLVGESQIGYSPAWLAFDASGHLWADDFEGNVIFQYPADELAGSGTASFEPSVRITLGILALLEGLAFDDEGGLWVALSQGRFGRLAPTQLSTSSGPGEPTEPQTVITSGDVGSVSNIALYPAPAALPLFHRWP